EASAGSADDRDVGEDPAAVVRGDEVGSRARSLPKRLAADEEAPHGIGRYRPGGYRRAGGAGAPGRFDPWSRGAGVNAAGGRDQEEQPGLALGGDPAPLEPREAVEAGPERRRVGGRWDGWRADGHPVEQHAVRARVARRIAGGRSGRPDVPGHLE